MSEHDFALRRRKIAAQEARPNFQPLAGCYTWCRATFKDLRVKLNENSVFWGPLCVFKVFETQYIRMLGQDHTFEVDQLSYVADAQLLPCTQMKLGGKYVQLCKILQ